MLTQKAANRKDINTGISDMQHRHFATIAAIIRKLPTHAATLRAQKESVTLLFADELAQTNPRFDRARFIAACNAPREA